MMESFEEKHSDWFTNCPEFGRVSLFIKCRIAKINIMKQKEFDLTFEQFNDVFQIYEQLQINSPQSKNVEEEASDSPSPSTMRSDARLLSKAQFVFPSVCETFFSACSGFFANYERPKG